MSDETLRRLERELLRQGKDVVAVDRRQTRVAFVAKDEGGSFVWGTVARNEQTARALFNSRAFPMLQGFPHLPSFTVVRIRVFEDTVEDASSSPANRSLPNGLTPPSSSSSSNEGPRT